jgi:hypothetical protein
MAKSVWAELAKIFGVIFSRMPMPKWQNLVVGTYSKSSKNSQMQKFVHIPKITDTYCFRYHESTQARQGRDTVK